MRKSLLILSVLLSLSAWAAKIYINPGHGSWSSNCRHMGVIPVPVGSVDANGYYSGNDTLGFFESNTNLWKGLFLEKKLLEKGYGVKMSRRYSGGTNELENSPYDKALHVIGAESQAYGSDYFISIHSNAHVDGYTTNYPLFIHKGYDNSETNSGSIWGEKILWDHHFKIFDALEPHSYYSATNKNIRGGMSMNGWDYGVLRTQSRPGTLVEGYFHTYQPARHRAMQPDWCRQEGLRYFRGFTEMYGTAKDTKGYIMGYVRTKDKQINQTNYTGRAGNDIYYPLNGAKIVLRDANGNIVKTDNYKYVARDVNNQNKSIYTTDNYYNGVFVYDDLTPGTYTISVHCTGYADVKQTVTVTAHETTYTQIFMTAGQGTEPDVNEVMGTSGLNPYAYDLTSSWDETSQKLTVRFSLNADAYVDGEGGYADGVQIHLSDDKSTPKKYYIYGLSKNDCRQGQNKTFTIDLSSGKDKHGKIIPRGVPLYVSITVQGDRSNTAPRQDSRSHKIYCGHGIAVDKNPNSKNFGRIFVNEARQEEARSGELSGYFTKGLAGMYVIDPDFVQRSSTRYTGSNDFSLLVIENTYDGLARKGYQPWRVRVSEEGRIFVCSNDMHQRQATNAAGERDGVAVWEVDRNDFTKWTPILKGYRRFVSGQTSTNYTFAYRDINGVQQFIGPICGMDVKGTGDDVTLLLYTVNQAGVWLGMKGFRAYEYNVKSGALKPVSAFNNGGYGYVFEFTTLRYGVDGSYWFGASRADGSDGVEGNGKTKEPNLGHVKLDGTSADYTNYNAEFYGGAGLLVYKSTYNNSDYNASNHTWLIKGRSNTATDGMFGVFLVTSDNNGGAQVARIDGKNGRPNWQEVVVNGIGRNLNDFAIDYAENLYVIGNSSSSGGLVRAFAMPYCGEKTTTVRDDYKFELKGQAITWHPYHCPVEKIRNKDLWLMFMDAYNDWYKQSTTQPIVVTRADQKIEDAFLFMFNGEKENDGITHKYPDGLAKEFMTDPNSPWKWLGDYILDNTNNVTLSQTNEDLWEEFKKYFNEYYPTNSTAVIGVKFPRADQSIDNITTFWPSLADQTQQVDPQAKIMTNQNSQFKWLGDYIKNIANDQNITITTEIDWRYNLWAFFNKQHRTTYPITADFTEAGKPENWRPYYVSPDGNRQIDTDLEWREEIHAFFNTANQCVYENLNKEEVTITTADYRTSGQPDQENNGLNGWFDEWWNATFTTYILANDELQLPYLRSDGYLLEGWYYGDEQGFYYLNNKDRAGDYLYNETAANGRTHLWARWIDASVNEGYTTEPDQHALDLYGKNINCNEEVVAAACQLSDKGKSVTLDVQRKLQGGMYNTMMLPFAIPEKDYLLKVTDMNGNYVFDPEKGTMPSILVFEGYETINTGGEETLQLVFHELGEQPNNQNSEGREYESVPAYTPFLIQPEEDITSRLHFWPAYVSNSVPAPNNTGDINFVGHFTPSSVSIPDGSIMLILTSDNRLAKVTSSGTMMGLRGYFLMLKSMKSMPAQICIKENTTTNTEEVKNDTLKNGAYKILDNQRIYIIKDGNVYDILGHPSDVRR